MEDNGNADQHSSAAITIDVYGDFVCPWCYVGWKNLHAAIEQTGVDVMIRYRPFVLHPDLPVSEAVRRVDPVAFFVKEAGITLADEVSLASTLLANRLLKFAGEHEPRRPAQIVRLLYQAQFELGANLSSVAVLTSIASEAGYDTASVQKYLASSEDEAFVRQCTDSARASGVAGVPHYSFRDNQYTLTGGQSVSVFAHTLKALSRKPRL